MTYIHTNTSAIVPFVYLVITPGILTGKYLFMNVDKAFVPIFSLINVNILNNISTIATENTNAEKCLKYIINAIIITIITIKSIYIYHYLYIKISYF